MPVLESRPQGQNSDFATNRERMSGLAESGGLESGGERYEEILDS